MDNYQSVLNQMLAFGVEFKSGEELQIPTPKRKTCGVKGKWWYWLQLWRPRRDDGVETGAEYIVGRFGTYKHGGSDCKVEIDFQPPTEAERRRWKEERAAAAALAARAKDEAAQVAALGAAELWSRASREGASPYLARKGLLGEACRFLPDGTLVIPLLRYDKPREEALRAVQRILPDGSKYFTKGFAKSGCSLRLGQVDTDTLLVLVCEGYATGLTIRTATGRRWPVYVALDAYNLVWVVEILRAHHPRVHLLVCADDDWKTKDQDGPNPGRRKALLAAKTTPRCEIVWPVFDPALRREKDTDFNDLQLREGIEVVERQLLRVLNLIEQGIAARGA